MLLNVKSRLHSGDLLPPLALCVQSGKAIGSFTHTPSGRALLSFLATFCTLEKNRTRHFAVEEDLKKWRRRNSRVALYQSD